MKLLLYLIALLALWYLYITLRFVLKRTKLLHHIKRFAKEHNLQYDISVSAFLKPSNRCGTAVYMRKGDICYNIRLFGLLRKNCAVHYWNKEMYSVEKYIPRMCLVEDIPLGHRDVKRRYMGEWNLQSDSDIQVLLYSPSNSSIRITQTNVNHVERMIAGDMLDGVMFADWDYLFRYIEKRI